MREKSFRAARRAWCFRERRQALKPIERWASALDRKSTRLNSSHSQISYAVFCLKKKKKHSTQHAASGPRQAPYPYHSTSRCTSITTHYTHLSFQTFLTLDTCKRRAGTVSHSQ